MKKTEKAIWVGRILLVAFGLMLARPPLVRGALNAFIKIEGIEGESRDDGHEKWIDVLSFSWGMSRSAEASTSTGSGGAEKAVPGDITITKAIDRASPNLADFRTKGKIITSMIVDTVRKDGKPGREITTLKNVKIVSVTVGADGKTEKVKFAYQSYRLVFTAS
jgi:type VI secretion system secreted protein Hcp